MFRVQSKVIYRTKNQEDGTLMRKGNQQMTPMLELFAKDFKTLIKKSFNKQL